MYKLRFTHQDDDYVRHGQVEQVEVCRGSHRDISANKSFLIGQIKTISFYFQETRNKVYRVQRELLKE